MKSKLSHERLSQRWWRDWWSEDFSWSGLRSKAIGAQRHDVVLGSARGDKNLQEYWRRDSSGRLRTDAELLGAGELMKDATGQLWHACHVPLLWRDGTPAKSRWSETERAKVRTLIEERLTTAQPSRFFFDGQRAASPDGRAQLQGVVFCEAPATAASGVIRLCADFAWIPTWTAGASKFGAGACFRKALLDGHVHLHLATFEGALSFDDARILGDFTLGSVPDSRGAQFREVVSAQRAIFLGRTWLSRCGFGGGARFDRAHFAGEVELFASTLAGSVAFDHATFEAHVSFMSATLEALSFSSVRCRSFVDFSSTKFTAGCALFFRHTDFQGDVRFTGAKLPRAIPELIGGFGGTRFRAAADFEHTGCHWIAALDNAIVEQGLTLDQPGAPFLEREFAKRWLPAALKVPAEYEEMIPITRLKQLAALQGGCRTVRLHAERVRNGNLAQIYASFEQRIEDEVRRLPVPPDPEDAKSERFPT